MSPNDENTPEIRTALALMAQDIKYTNRQVDQLTNKINSSFVTKDEFTPVKEKVESVLKALIWVVSILVGALILAVVNQVLR